MDNEQVRQYIVSLGKLTYHVGEYLKALGEKAEIDQQHQCLEKIHQQLNQLQQQTLYLTSNSGREN